MTMTIFIVDQMLNVVLIERMSQLMKKMTWKITALSIQTLARILKLSQMTKQVIVLPIVICIYCIAGTHVTDSDLQPATSSSFPGQQCAALSQIPTSKRPLEKLDRRRKKRRLNEDIQVTKISVSNLKTNIIFM